MRVLIVSALVIMGLILAGCEKKTEEVQAPEAKAEAAPEAPEAKVEAAPAEEKKAEVVGRQLTEEIWVEIKAHELATLFTSEDKKLGPEARIKARDDVYKKYSVTKEDVAGFYNNLSETNASKAAKLAAKAYDKAEELRKK
jgi:hypothetical protein